MHAYEVLAFGIRDKITAGDLQPGERMPSELALASQYSVSRSTVREALRLLEESGLLERPSPKIMRVKAADTSLSSREFTRAMVFGDVTFSELMDALFVLEPALARLAAEHPDEAIIAELNQNLLEQAKHVDDYPTWWRLDQQFHQGIATMSRNRALTTARASIMDTVGPALSSMVAHAQSTRGLHHHRQVLEEVTIGDPDAAQLMMQKHVRDAFLAWQESGFNINISLAEWQRSITSQVSTAD
jgi:DNA-binding FadR family transcriptional regulator